MPQLRNVTVLLIVMVTALAASMAVSTPAAAEPQRRAVIDQDTVWSHYFIARSDQRKNIGQPARPWPQPVHGYPPADWHATDFDDSGWGMAPAPFPAGTNRWGHGHRASGAGSILLRSRFRVEDPAAAELRLNLTYRGGAIVYLNGHEIARQDLEQPEGEDVSVFDIPAVEYPFEAWYSHDDRPLDWSVDEDVEGALREHLKRYRLRSIEDLELPAGHLRRGVNVLAIQLNAAPSPDRRHFFREQRGQQVRRNFSRLGLVEARLEAPGGRGGVKPGTTDERGLFIGAISPLQEIDERSVAALRHLPRRGLKLVGPRGGYATAPLVVSHDRAIAPPRVRIASLRGEDGASLADEAITLLHGSRHHRDAIGAADGHRTATHHILSQKPGEEADLHSVWVEVRIPRDAAPGRYTGEAIVEAAGTRQTLPIELHVGRFTMPAPDQTLAVVDMLHNPENTARRYGVAMWSDEHFELMGKVFDHKAAIGSDVLYLPMAMDNHLGTHQTLVRWVKGSDGYEVDLSVAERYLRLFDERFGRPRVLGLYLWDVIMGERRGDGHATVTVVDPDSGEVSRESAPWYGAPGSEAFWKPAIDGVLAIVDDLGWDREAVMIASGHDRKPRQQTREFFQQIAPGMKWVVISHARGYGPRDGQLVVDGLEVGYHAYPWQATIDLPERGIIGGWDGEFLQTTLARFHFSSFSSQGRTPATYRALISNAIGDNRSRSFRGVSRFQLDYWPVPREEDASQFTRLLRMGGWVNLMRNHEFLLAPGPDGPEPTVAFAQLREGAQESEARLAIERVLADEQRRSRLDEDLLERAYAVIREHAGIIRAGSKVWQGYPSLPWREHAVRLFDTAGEIAQRLGE